MNYKISFLAITILLFTNISVSAQPIPSGDSRGYSCSKFGANTYARSPNWKVESDGFSGQSVLLHFKKKDPSSVRWIRNNKPYYSAKGLGFSMKSGFSIAIFGESFVEMYVFNAGNSQLIYTKIRSGDDRLPNSIQTAIAQCDGAGKLVR